MTRPTRLDRFDLLSLGLLAGAGAITAAVWTRLPDRVPIHFDIHGNPDAWGSRPLACGLMLGASLLVWSLLRFGGVMLPRSWRERFEASPVSAVATITVALLVTIHLFVVWAALHPGGSIAAPLTVAFGVFSLVLALVLPRVRRNPFIGVRTAWTLSSDENWARTHRFASWSFGTGGLLAVLLGVASAPALGLAAVILTSLLPVLYSYVVARQTSA